MKRKRHFNISKTSFVSSTQSDPATVNPRDVLTDESKQADIENLGDCLRALGDRQSMGDFSLTIVLYAEKLRAIDGVLADFAAAQNDETCSFQNCTSAARITLL